MMPPVCAVGGAQPRSDLGRARPAAAAARAGARDRQRLGRAHGALCAPRRTATDVSAERPRCVGSRQHRRLGGRFRLAECPAGDRARCRRRRLAHRPRRRRRLHQHDPHLAVGLDRRTDEAAPRACCRRAACCSSTGPTSAKDDTRRPATRHSTPTCAGAIPPGACATSKPSPNWPRTPGLKHPP